MSAKCRHENVRVYTEQAFEGRFENGIVVYDPKNEEDSHVIEAVCMECGAEWDAGEVEAMS